MLTVDDLTKSFDTTRRRTRERVGAVNGVSFRVDEGELFTLLGPSGCGKTTTLRCIAGFENPDMGRITVGDRVVFSSVDGIRVPANDRRLGVVFQSYAIWPHMSVAKNVAFPLEVLPRRERPGRAELQNRVEQALAAVHLGDLAGRPATDLSGGQQQRLALARAIVLQPPLMLLDEPLSNLDAKLREEMRLELKRLQRELSITTVYVTHDQVEALSMSNIIGVMSDGALQQVSTPRELYQRPASRFVADFVGATNLLSGTVARTTDDKRLVVRTACGDIAASSAAPLRDGSEIVVSIRPEQISLARPEAPPPTDGVTRLMGTVGAQAFYGDAVDSFVRVGACDFKVRQNPNVTLAEGASVGIDIPAEHAYVIPLDD